MFRLLMLLMLIAFEGWAVQSVKIGVLAKRSDAITTQRWHATAEYLSQAVPGFFFEIVPLGFETLFESVAQGDIDFVLTNTMYYVELEHRYGVSRIATLKNLGSGGEVLTSFGGVIVTKNDSGIGSLQELKGKRFGAVDANSFGGWVMALQELRNHDIDVDDFSEFHFFGSHDAVILAIKEGRIDAGTVRTDTIERMNAEGLIDSNVCRVLAAKHYPGFPFSVSTELYPEWPFAKLPHTSERLADQVLVALLQMTPDSEAARTSHVAGWTIPLDYSKVHDLLESLHLGPYADMGKLTFGAFFDKYRMAFIGTLLLFAIIILAMLLFVRLNTKLREKQQQVTQLNNTLEKRVKMRTEELERAYGHEKYLKDILKTIADVNELLVTSFSTQTVVSNSMEVLSKNKYYGFVWIGLIQDHLLEVVSQSKRDMTILDQARFDLNDHEVNFAFKCAKSAIELNTTVIEKLPEHYRLEIGKGTYNCTSCWMITLPLRSGEESAPLGTLAVFSERDKGFEDEELEMLEKLATDIGSAITSIRQRTALEAMELEKISNYEETILAFVDMIEQRDSYTAGHTIRVAHYSRMIAEAMGIDESQIEKLEKAAILHDIGKVVTPDAILLKPGTLTPLEYELIKHHASAGYRMLSRIEMYKDLAEIIRYHHSRYDGKGYPATSADHPDTVPMLSYIMEVADAFDAMTTNRIYKPRKSIEEALKEIETYAGSQFHPIVAKAALRALVNAQIDETTQMPQSELEQRRFAYFFSDSLTDLYNEDYLKTILLNRNEHQQVLMRIDLKNFSSYNRQFGWDQGNELLRCFATHLRKTFPKGMVFRYHGDNFMLLGSRSLHIDQEQIRRFGCFEGTGIVASIEHFDLEKEVPSL